MTQLADKDMTETFWDRLEDCRTGMLVIEGRAVPMSHYVDENKRELWFITAKGTPRAGRHTMFCAMTRKASMPACQVA